MSYDRERLADEVAAKAKTSFQLFNGVNEIIETECKLAGVHPNLVTETKLRTRTVAKARQRAMARIYLELGLTFTEVSYIFKRDHSTVVHAVRKYKRQLNENNILL